MSARIEELHFPNDGTAYLVAAHRLFDHQVLFKRFRFHDEWLWRQVLTPPLLQTIASLSSLPEIDDAFRGQVHPPACSFWHKSDVEFEKRYPVEWPGALARLLCDDTFSGKGLSAEVALDLAHEHLRIVHPAQRSVAAFSDTSWCAFHNDVNWDHTFIAFDHDRTVSVLLLTDTD